MEEATRTVRWRAEEVIAGNKEALQRLREFIILPLLYRCDDAKLGIKWPRGVLIHGPPGTGKTSLIRAVVRECGAQLTVICPNSVYRADAGESEKVMRNAFLEASSRAGPGKPSVIFIDEIDVMCSRRVTRSEQNVRITYQLMALMDSILLRSPEHVTVIASTNKLDSIDPALRRSGRFDVEIEVSMPSEAERLEILKLYTKDSSLASDVDLQFIASSCNGYVGRDLETLCLQAGMSAFFSDRGKPEGHLVISMKDWEHARTVVSPCLTRGVTAEIPKVTWEDIGGLDDVKKKLQQVVEWPIKHAEAFTRLGISPFRGVLLYGPPGCSKTTLVKAAANAAKASFFSFSNAELYSMYVGEGEAFLREKFRKARLASPSIIFIDEVDSVAAKRGAPSNKATGEGLLTTLLTEMDGLETIEGVLVLAATNRPQAIDPALMRPGRFDLVLYVPPPDVEGRHKILSVHTRNMTLGSDVSLRRVAEATECFTGADLENLCKEAGIVAIRDDLSSPVVHGRYFDVVMSHMKPSISPGDLLQYHAFMNQYLT